MRVRVAAVVVMIAVAMVSVPPAGAEPADQCRAPIRPAPIIAVSPCDSVERIVTKAANVVPTREQLAWQRQRVLAFTHFGMNTFTDREWGSGAEDPAWFAPDALDVDQWMRAYKAAGARLVMLTVKHHDGFVLYPTRYSGHSVAASPWWRLPDGTVNPAGDVFGEYVRAARAAGLKVGVYLSPSDGAEHPHAWHAGYVERIREKHEAGLPLSLAERVTLEDGDRPPGGLGRYGNGSPAVPTTIPTPVRGDDRAGRDLPTFQFTVDDYNAYYLNQIYELFTQYGPIDEFWLDGANPWADAGLSAEYDFAAWFRLIHALSPGTLIDEGPRGFRWVGNEAGVARENEWSPTPYTGDPETGYGQRLIIGGWPDGPTAPDLGSRARLADPSVRYLSWMPAEADVSIRPGWFHHANQAPKSAERLTDLYRRSVGHNSVLLLNVPPNPLGRLDEADVVELTRFGTAIGRTYRPEQVRQVHWRPRDGATTGDLVLPLGGRQRFDQVVLGEGVERGQRIEAFTVDAWTGTGWQQIAEGGTMGDQRILVLPEPVSTDRLRVRVVQSRATPLITSVGLHTTVAP
jgi:alpha-L-fucosidase